MPFNIQKVMITKSKLKQHLISIWVKEIFPSPLLIFGLFCFSYFTKQVSITKSILLLIAQTAFMVILKRNPYFVFNLAVSSYVIGIWPLNIVLGLIATNQEWKTYLFLFTIGNFVFEKIEGVFSEMIIFPAMIIGILTYRSLLFRSLWDNKIYFTGFSTISFLIIIRRIASQVVDEQNTQIFLSNCFIPIGLYLFWQIIYQKIKELGQTDPRKINSPLLAVQYAEIISQSYQGQSRAIEYHQYYCSNIQCFCRTNQSFSSISLEDKLRLKSDIWQSFLIQHSSSDWEHLQNKYVASLIQKGSIPYAAFLMNRISGTSGNIFRIIERIRNQQALLSQIQRMMLLSQCPINYTTILVYQKDQLEVRKRIIEITKQKLNFFDQISKKSSQLAALKSQSLYIVRETESLHRFYLSKIRSAEAKIKNYNATKNYAYYLLSNYNYKELAKRILNDHKKTKQSDHINFQSRDIKYCVETFLCDPKIKDTQCSTEALIECRISNISRSFCSYLKIHRRELIGKSINSLIPLPYQKNHDKIVRNLLTKPNYTSKAFGAIKKFPVWNQSIQILEELLISLNLSYCPEKGLRVVAILQKIAQKSRNKKLFITNFNIIELNNSILPYQADNNCAISAIKQMKQQWIENKCVTPKEISVKQLYGVKIIKISSPFHYIFEKCQSPAIHIEIQNFNSKSGITKSSYRLQTQDDLLSKNDSSSNQSRISDDFQITTLRKTLQLLNGSKMLKTYFRMTLLISFLIIIIFLVLSFQHHLLNIPWEVGTNFQNPIKDITSLYLIERHLLRLMNFNQDIIATFSLSMISFESWKEVYDFLDFEKFYQSRTESSYQTLKLNIFQILSTKSSLLAKEIDNILLQTIQYRDKLTGITQILNIQNFFANYIFDLHYIKNYMNSAETTLLFGSFQQKVEPSLRQLIEKINNTILSIFSQLINQNIYASAVYLFLIFLMLIPLILITRKCNENSRFIYQILVGLDISTVRKQTKHLKQLLNFMLKEQQKIQQENIDSCQIKKQISRKSVGEVINEQKQHQWRNWLLYSMLLVSSFFIIFGVCVKVKEIHRQKDQFEYFSAQISTINKEGLLLMNTKIYMDDRGINEYNGISLGKWIQDQMQKNNHKQLQFTAKYEYQILKCLKKQLVCKNSYSQAMLGSLLRQYTRKGFMAKRMSQKQKMNITGERLGLLFAGNIIFEKYQATRKRLDYIQQNNTREANKMSTLILIIYVLSLVWNTVALLVSISIIRSKNHEYIQQVCILNFLSVEMIRGNKYVESFLNKLNKEVD